MFVLCTCDSQLGGQPRTDVHSYMESLSPTVPSPGFPRALQLPESPFPGLIARKMVPFSYSADGGAKFHATGSALRAKWQEKNQWGPLSYYSHNKDPFLRFLSPEEQICPSRIFRCPGRCHSGGSSGVMGLHWPRGGAERGNIWEEEQGFSPHTLASRGPFSLLLSVTALRFMISSPCVKARRKF